MTGFTAFVCLTIAMTVKAIEIVIFLWRVMPAETSTTAQTRRNQIPKRFVRPRTPRIVTPHSGDAHCARFVRARPPLPEEPSPQRPTRRAVRQESALVCSVRHCPVATPRLPASKDVGSAVFKRTKPGFPTELHELNVSKLDTTRTVGHRLDPILPRVLLDKFQTPIRQSTTPQTLRTRRMVE